MFFFFFFSSRRRHTRFDCDWSSDVCSSDLIVDTVLYFEGESTLDHRILRAVKNRFGSVDEIGVFEMTGAGLEPVADPAAAFLAGRTTGVSGSAVTALMEGTRPLLVEIQALAA